MVRAQIDAQAKEGMLAATDGCVPFHEWLDGNLCLMWRGMLAADPSAAPMACYCEAHVFVSCVPSRRSPALVCYVKSGGVSPRSRSAASYCGQPCITMYFLPAAQLRASTFGTNVGVRYAGQPLRLHLLSPLPRQMVVCGTHPSATRCTAAIE